VCWRCVSDVLQEHVTWYSGQERRRRINRWKRRSVPVYRQLPSREFTRGFRGTGRNSRRTELCRDSQVVTEVGEVFL